MAADWMTPEICAKMDKLREEGASVKAIAQKIDKPENQVTYYFALKRKALTGGKKKDVTSNEPPKVESPHIQAAIDALWAERDALVLRTDEIEKAIESLKSL